MGTVRTMTLDDADGHLRICSCARQAQCLDGACCERLMECTEQAVNAKLAAAKARIIWIG